MEDKSHLNESYNVGKHEFAMTKEKNATTLMNRTFHEL